MRNNLNPQSAAIAEAQTEIKLAVKEEFLCGWNKARARARIDKIVKRALSRLTSPTLKRDAEKGFLEFANRCYALLVRSLPSDNGLLVSSMLLLAGGRATGRQRAEAERIVRRRLPERARLYTTDAKGVPLQEYSKEYMKKVVKAFKELAGAEARAPESGNLTLRAKAELQVRYEATQGTLADMRARGVRLIYIPPHADCSERCAPWQDRIYSLDGSWGTVDGRPFVPIETATDIYYTTKAGKTYQNGLFGFGCRHEPREYKPGMVIPRVPEVVRKAEESINARQRAYERAIVKARERALLLKDVDRGEYLQWRKKAIELNREYIRFSREHERAYYPARTKILEWSRPRTRGLLLFCPGQGVKRPSKGACSVSRSEGRGEEPRLSGTRARARFSCDKSCKQRNQKSRRNTMALFGKKPMSAEEIIKALGELDEAEREKVLAAISGENSSEEGAEPPAEETPAEPPVESAEEPDARAEETPPSEPSAAEPVEEPGEEDPEPENPAPDAEAEQPGEPAPGDEETPEETAAEHEAETEVAEAENARIAALESEIAGLKEMLEKVVAKLDDGNFGQSPAPPQAEEDEDDDRIMRSYYGAGYRRAKV